MTTFSSSFVMFMLLTSLSLSTQRTPKPKPPSNLSSPISLSFSLTTLSLSHHSSKSKYLSSLTSSPLPKAQNGNFTKPPPSSLPTYNFKSSFKYSMALIVSLPIGTPPQAQQMVLDTGSQLSWIQCHNKAPPNPPPTASFDPSLSSSFSILPCSHPQCKPKNPDFTLPTSCDQKHLCHYSYFYADGTLAEGNLVREKFTLSSTQITPPLILGCATDSDEAEGILGMNLGRLSFASQAKVSKFSYCVPLRQKNSQVNPSGSFYLGQNPNSNTFQYIDMLTFQEGQRMPNFDPLAYTVGLSGIRIGGKKLNISKSVFVPDPSGCGQTMIDSGTEYTYLVEEAYAKVREEIARLVGHRLKRDYTYQQSMDMCFDEKAATIGPLIGDMVLEFDKSVEVLIEKDRILDDVDNIGISCFGIGRSDLLGIPGNIIGNFHQQNLWVEFDVTNRKVGFGKTDCSKS